jgi:uncharacterized protein YsxB (DUF464 family)
MIDITCHVSHHSLTVKGHAGSNAYGRDLICAAVSSLVLTLAANVGHLEEGGFVSEAVVILESGNARIRCKPKQPYRDRVEQVFESICLGFQLLARKFPNHVAYREIDN